jgi:hypothetical protein
MRKIKGEKTEDKPTLVGGELDLQAEIGKQSEQIQQLIKDGQIIADITAANRTVEGKKYAKQYLRLKPTTARGVLAINPTETTWKKSADKDGNDTSDFDGPCWVKDFFYGNDLGVKNKVSGQLAVAVEGPDKAMGAAAKQLAKAFGISEDEALAKIKQMGQSQ